MHILISITSHTIRDIISILMAILFASLNTSMVDWQVDFLFSFDLFKFFFFIEFYNDLAKTFQERVRWPE